LYDIVRIGVPEDTMTLYYNIIIIGYNLRGHRERVMFNLAFVLIWVDMGSSQGWGGIYIRSTREVVGVGGNSSIRTLCILESKNNTARGGGSN